MKSAFSIPALSAALTAVVSVSLAIALSIGSAGAAWANQSALPPCRLDSFVAQAGSRAEAIYGDEGFRTPPPFFGFTNEHRIASGIVGQRDAGLTTGHSSIMPCASGRDEYISASGEWCYSGPNGGTNAYIDIQDQGYDASFRISIFEDKITHLNALLAEIDAMIARIPLAQRILPPGASPAFDPILTKLYDQRHQIVVAINDTKKELQATFDQQGGGGKE